MPEATGTFAVKGWDERTLIERAPGKLSQASVTQDVSGGIEGAGRVEWLMSYRADGTADFVGLQEITGRLDGREGSFVVTSIGVFDGKKAEGEWRVVEGSGADGLAGISGTGGFTAPHGGQASYRLNYRLR
jgi:hypothetical protein